MPKTPEEMVDKYKLKNRVGAYNPEDFTPPKRKYEMTDGNNGNPWISFAKKWALDHDMTMGCAVRNKECRLEYNTKYKVKKNVKNAPPQLQKWVKHTKANAKATNNCVSCEFTNIKNQEDYHQGEIAVAPRKTPAKTLSVADLEEKLDRLLEEYKQVTRGEAVGNLKAIDANIIRTRKLLDEREHAYQSNPRGRDRDDEDDEDDDEYEGRFEGIGQKEKKKPKHHLEPNEIEAVQRVLEKREKELADTVEAYTEDAELHKPKNIKRFKEHAKELKKEITQLKNLLYKNNVLMRPPAKPRKPRQKKGGSMMTVETQRLGHPEGIQNTDLRNASQIPVPSQNYNAPFSNIPMGEPQRRGKLSGYGRISDKRNMSLFKNDASVIPM